MKYKMLAIHPYVPPELLIHFGYPRRNIRSEQYSQPPFGSFLCDPKCDSILNGIFVPLFSYPNSSFLPPHYIYEIYKPIVTVFSKKISNFFDFFVFRETPRLQYPYACTILRFGMACTGMSSCQNMTLKSQILLALS